MKKYKLFISIDYHPPVCGDNLIEGDEVCELGQSVKCPRKTVRRWKYWPCSYKK